MTQKSGSGMDSGQTTGQYGSGQQGSTQHGSGQSGGQTGQTQSQHAGSGSHSGHVDINTITEMDLGRMSHQDIQDFTPDQKQELSRRFGSDWQNKVGKGHGHPA